MIEVHDARVSYEDGQPVLREVSCTVRPGELVALVGANGSGKSTLGALMCGARLPDAGRVAVDGHDVTADDNDCRAIRALVGMVRQDPSDQIVSTLVSDDVAFGPRNLGLSEEEVSERVHEALKRAGLFGFETRDTTALSGGEQQRVAIAGMLAMRPSYLVLDEATCQLDSAARPTFRALFDRLARAEGLGVVQITHDPVEMLASDRVVVLDAGRIIWEGTPRALLVSEGAPTGVLPERDAYVLALRAALRDGYFEQRIPTPEELLAWLKGSQGSAVRRTLLASFAPFVGCPRSIVEDAAPVLRLREAGYSYGNVPALDGVSLDVCTGRILLLAGRSGSGKSTLAQLAAGLLEPSTGSVELAGAAGGKGAPARAGDCALAFQNPEGQFFLDTVHDELAFAARNFEVSNDEANRRVRHAASQVGLTDDMLVRYPFTLSGGQARRVAIASVLTLDARVCIMDEPSAGLDAAGRHFAHGLARRLALDGIAVVVISHDLEEWMGVADDVALLDAGRIVWQGTAAMCGEDPSVFERCGLVAPFVLQLLREGRSASAAPLSSPECVASSSSPARIVGERRAFVSCWVDARVSILGLLALTACVFLCHEPASFAVWLIVAASLLRMAGLGLKDALRALRPVCLVLAFALCANLVSCDGGAAIPLAGPIGLNPSGGLRGFVAVLRILTLVSCSLAVAAATEPTELSDAVVRLLRPFARVGLPVGALGTVLSLALRFIPLVGEELSRIRTAQRARGVRFDEGSVVHRIRVWTSVLTPLIVGLFRRADCLADAMSARCYAGAGGAVQVPRKLLSTRDRIALTAIAIVTAATALLSLKGWV